MKTAVVGINWGDEGKGRMVDLLAERYGVVVRYQGGNNAGHTVVNSRGKFILNLLPSGILRSEVVNVMGNGMVIDIEHLCGEIEKLTSCGVSVTPQNLKISDRAVICLPYHRTQDILEEDRLQDAKYGSTRRGIAPVYGDKYMKKGIRMGDLRYPDDLKRQLKEIAEWKNLTLSGGYGAPRVQAEEMLCWLNRYGEKLLPFITDTGKFLAGAVKTGENILFEAQLGALRDIDFGIYPYTSSSSTIASYAPIGAGIPGEKLDDTVGIMKAYSSCVGEGPFVAELFGEEAELLRRAGNEYGAATGRPRRVGPFDAVASRYGAAVQGADRIALTKLDVLSYLDKIPVCTGYEIDGEVVTRFPLTRDLYRAKPVYIRLDGWHTDISSCRSWEELPAACRKYVEYLQNAVECKIAYLSVGAERDACIAM